MNGWFQDEARRRNARKSTGPRTAQGKANSRVNSMKHGLTGQGIVMRPDMRDWYEEQRRHLGACVHRDRHHAANVEQDLALAAVRLDASRLALRRRVDDHWDDDRERAVQALARELAERPEEVSLRLEMTSRGVAWKLARLQDLADALRSRGTWSPDEKQLFLDLLGVPPIVRRYDDDIDDIEICDQILVEERARLEALKADVLDPEDESARLEALIGVPHDDSREARLLRRYESENWRKYEKLSEKLGMNVRDGERAPRPVVDQAAPTAAPPPRPPMPTPPVGASAGPTARRLVLVAAVVGPRARFQDEAGDTPCGWEGSRGPRGRTREGRPLTGGGRPVRQGAY